MRARQRFSNSFTAIGLAPAGWARVRSLVPVAPGRYLIRVAAVGANGMQGSVFTEADVPKFSADLGLGGLSFVAPGMSGLVNATDPSLEELSPLASRDLPAHTPLAAHLPIRVAGKRAATSLTITATLEKAEGETLRLEHTPRAVSDYAKPAGGVCRIAFPPGLAVGSYRLVVDVASERARATREMTFRIVAGPPRDR